MSDWEQQNTSQIGSVLTRLRKKKRFTKQALADASGVSATYVGLIENGIDPNSGRRITPSAKVLRALAKALADGDAREEGQVYEELMAAVGYIEATPITLQPAAPFPGAVLAAAPVSITLRDVRLLAHCRALLENWESLTPDDQEAALAFFRVLDEKRRLQSGD